MGKSCVVMPKRGKNLFSGLKRDFGYQLAVGVYNIGIDPKFQEDFKDKLTLDEEGIPTKESLLSVPYVKNFIGKEPIRDSLDKKYPMVEDTADNYKLALNEAKNFNENNENNDKFVAVVEKIGDKLKVTIYEKTPEAVQKFNDLYSALMLNEFLLNKFKGIITPEMLSALEVQAGRAGVTDFNLARRLAQGFASMIRIANNMEGVLALPEEFCHVLVEALKDNPLVLRALNSLKNVAALKKVLGEDFDDTLEFQEGDLDRMAEEALGLILRDNMQREVSLEKTKAPSLFRRLISFVKNLFKNYSANEVDKAILDADNSMKELAKNIVDGTITVTKDLVEGINRDALFNALSNNVERNINILKEAAKVEIKRGKLTKESAGAEQRVTEILRNAQVGADTELGLLNYAKQALAELRVLNHTLNDPANLNKDRIFRVLRNVRMYLLSYKPFIDAVANARDEDEGQAGNMFEREFVNENTLDEVESLGEVFRELKDLSDKLDRQFFKIANKSLTEFFKPFFGEEIVVPFGKKRGLKITVEDLLKEAESDISFLDRWLDAASDSSDLLIQLVNAAITKAKNAARLNTIEDIQEIQRLMLRAKELGITDFDWMFERDSSGNKSGNYISEINFALFEADRKAMEADLEEKYGKNPSGAAARAKIAERKAWIETHAYQTVYGLLPKPDVYRNQDYFNLPESKRTILLNFLELKARFDARYPASRVAANKAILIRKDGTQRFFLSLSDPSKIFENMKKAAAEAILDRVDDDSTFGDRTTKGITDFDGREFMMMPVLYTNELENPNELSTDVFSTLMAYAFSTNTYQLMSKVVDPLEITRTIVSDTDKGRKVRKTRGGKPIQEKIESLETTVMNKVFHSSGSNIQDRLEDLLESLVYLKYLKDQGTFEVFGKEVNANKMTSMLLKASALALMGFNWLANTANVATGVAMLNIEAAASEYFSAKELALADAVFTSLILSKMSELGDRVKTNKLDLLGLLFDIKQDFNRSVKRQLHSSLLKRIFGEHIAFLGLDAGDYWLYYRTAIAMLKHTKVLVPKFNTSTRRVSGLEAAREVVDRIISDSQKYTLTEDEKFYTDEAGNKLARVTSIIGSETGDIFETTHADGRPNNWITPSTNIGTGMDELVRDFFSGLIQKDAAGNWTVNSLPLNLKYPNATKEDLDAFATLLLSLKEDLDRQGLNVVSRDIVVKGQLRVSKGGKPMMLNVAGTVDLLVYDKEGNFYIYDMKTHRGAINEHKKLKWSSQLSLYKKFLEDLYGINVKGLKIVPIKVSYPTPSGERALGRDGDVDYTVVNGTNLLLANGTEFKGAKPSLEELLDIDAREVNVDYDLLGDNTLAITEPTINRNDYTEMSAWDALVVRSKFADSDKIKEMVMPEGTLNADGTLFDVGRFGRLIAHVNHGLFGIYNDDDLNAANRVIAGRCIMLYRKWIKPLFNKRFQKSQYSVVMGKFEEGYYRTFFRVANELIRGSILISALKDQLEDHEKANINRAIFEFIQWLLVFALANGLDWPDDKDRPQFVKLAEYMAKREAHELGQLTPTSFNTFIQENLKTFKSPSAVLNTIQNGANLAISLANPWHWTDEIKQGTYKGMSTLEKNFWKAPLPIVAQYKQVDRFLNDLDISIGYYARPY